MKKFIVLALLLAFTAGCSTLHSSQPTGGLSVEAKSELKADISVGEKISGSSSLTYICFVWCLQLPGGPSKFADGVEYKGAAGLSTPFGNFDQFGSVKAAAAYDAVNKAKADVIIAPRYVIEANDFLLFKTVNATVNGYKGTIKGFK